MSNIKLDFTGVKDDSADRKGRIRPGIHMCRIVEVGHGTNQNEKQFISVKLENEDSTREHEEMFFLSTDKAVEWTKKRLVHLIDNVTGSKKELAEIDLVAINKLLKGKLARFLFVGEEYEYNGEVRIKTMLNFLPFAENNTVTTEASKFEFDESRNIKRLKRDGSSMTKLVSHVITAAQLDQDMANDGLKF